MARPLLCLLAVVAGCGYGLAGTGRTVPEGARTVSVRLFANRTREEELAVMLKRAIEAEFRRRGQLRVVSDGEGDLVLSGVVRRFVRIPVAAAGFDETVQFQGVLQVGVRLRERASGRLLYADPALQESQDFAGVSGTVVTASPQFQREAVAARDVAHLTSVELAESRRRQALVNLVEAMARQIYVHALEGF